MSLRDQVLADVAGIVENSLDFGEPITLIEPDGTTNAMTGFTGDISAVIEPDSGAIVKGRRVHVTLRIASLPAGERPVVKNKLTDKPWRVSFPRITTGTVTEYAVVGTDPDDAMGTIVLELGAYIP